MGSFYRSKHELIFVLKIATLPQTNSYGLSETGPYCANVWHYAGNGSLCVGGSESMLHRQFKLI